LRDALAVYASTAQGHLQKKPWQAIEKFTVEKLKLCQLASRKVIDFEKQVRRSPA
jgi:hypothetical protein